MKFFDNNSINKSFEGSDGIAKLLPSGLIKSLAPLREKSMVQRDHFLFIVSN